MSFGTANPAGITETDPIVVDIELRPEDLLDYWIWQHFGSHAAAISRRAARRDAWFSAAAIFLLPAGAFGIFAGLAALVRVSGLPDWVVSVSFVFFFIALLGVAFSIANILGVVTAPRAAVYARARRGEAERLCAGTVPFRLSIGPDGVELRVAESQKFTPWTEYLVIHNTPSLIVSRDASRREGFTPKRVFGEGEARDRALRRINAWAAAKGAGHAASLKSLLSEQVHSCPRCRYSLAGLTGLTCPECGLAIEPDLLPVRRQRKQAWTPRAGT
jgi:hypothetical protein